MRTLSGMTTLPRRPFGRTGHGSSRVIFGAAALGSMSQERADAVLEVARAGGINHIDTAAGYGDSELRLQPFLARHRRDVFLATKTGERTGPAARAELERSLDRMGVDSVDLIQLHNLVEPDEWDTAHAPGGALEALVAARDEGLVRFIGVTGHGTRIPSMHLRSLERFDYDSVLAPYNQMMMSNPQYAAEFERLVQVCVDRGVAIQTIKSAARRRWAADSTGPHFAWYEPLPAGPALDRAVAFTLCRDDLFLNSSSDARLLRPIIDAASRPIVRPAADDLAADALEWDMAPLFDGAALERI
jgi:aryl-alcohol dehydrogenase-like predicted oxidoreductase